MAKARTATVFFCQNCGYESAKWMGQCPACKQWNTLVEEKVSVTGSGMGEVRRSPRQRTDPNL